MLQNAEMAPVQNFAGINVSDLYATTNTPYPTCGKCTESTFSDNAKIIEMFASSSAEIILVFSGCVF